MAKKKQRKYKSVTGYVFPDDYKPKLDPNNPGMAYIPARPGLQIEADILGPDGEPIPDAMPMHLHYINLFLEDLITMPLDSVEAVRTLLSALIKASVLDKESTYKGIYNAINAIKVFLTTEDVYQFSRELSDTIAEFEKVKNYLKQDDINMARAEAKRDNIAIEVKE